MDDKNRVMDLTMFNHRLFRGKFRLRYIFDWAQDYWKEGERLGKVILNRYDYEDLIHEIENQNIFVKQNKIHELKTIDAGFGEIEIEPRD